MKKELIIILVLTIFGILIEGYKFGEENHVNYFSLSKARVDANLFSKDFYIQNTEYYGFFYDSLVRFSGQHLETVSFFLYFILTFFTFWATYKITFLLFKDKYVSYLAILFMIIPKTTLAAVHTRDYILYHTAFVLPFLLLAIYLFLKRKYIWAFIILGLSFNFHGMTSLFVLFMFLFYFVLEFKKINKSKALLACGSFLLFASPLLIKILTGKGNSLIPSNLWMEIVKVRLGHHIFPSTWSWFVWIGFIFSVVLFGIAYGQRYKSKKLYNKKILSFSFAMLIVAVVGIIFSELFPLRPIIQLHVLRIISFFTIFALFYAANLIIRLMKKDSSVLNLIGVVLAVVLFYSGNLKIILVLLVFSVVVFFFVKSFRETKIFLKLIIFTVFIFLIISSIGAIGWKGRDHVNLPWVESYSAWSDIRNWAKESTPTNSLFITGPYKSFRFYSERSVFVTGKDFGLGIILNPRGEELAPEYLKRFRLINCDYLEGSADECVNKYHLLTKKKILEIKGQYDVDYIIFDKPKKLDFVVAYENEEFIVYIV
tara:strand:+ start:3149 stop:4771 length:1623 start_codon:yes stop_codon:yes gene_type:complete